MGTSINIKHTKAEEIILKAYRTKCLKSDDITTGITTVLTGSRKTYKYILITGILAKASNTSTNPIALQAGAPLKGAFDARSLCHKVLVPFERDFLDNVLGGSNEPFLNLSSNICHPPLFAIAFVVIPYPKRDFIDVNTLLKFLLYRNRV